QPFMNDTFDWPQWPALNVPDADVIDYFQAMVTLGDPLGDAIPAGTTGQTPDPVAPDAEDDSAAVEEDGPAVTIDVLANDAPGSAMPAITAIDGTAVNPGGVVTLGSGAVVTLTLDGTLSYDPGTAFQSLNTGQTGADSFGYTIGSDAGTDTATVSVTIAGADEVPPPPATGVVGEAGILTFFQPDRSTWLRVDFATEIEDPTVVMGPLTGRGGQPATLRVRDVTETGFEVQIDEWEYLDGYHIEESVSWLAVSAGTHQLADGRILAAGTTTGRDGWSDHGFDVSFDTVPVVVAQVTSVNDADTATVRLRDVTDSGFSHRLQEEEAADGRHGAESLSWIAVETGSDDVLAGRTGNTVADRYGRLDFGDAFDTTPAFLAAMQTTNGGDTATVRQDDDWSADGARIRIEEEKSRDAEVRHINENVGFVALDTGLLLGETLDTLL
ncbi:MAG: VCBS domain-containing protein, partial [Pseudomonadota bacterium]